MYGPRLILNGTLTLNKATLTGLRKPVASIIDCMPKQLKGRQTQHKELVPRDWKSSLMELFVFDYVVITACRTPKSGPNACQAPVTMIGPLVGQMGDDGRERTCVRGWEREREIAVFRTIGSKTRHQRTINPSTPPTSAHYPTTLFALKAYMFNPSHFSCYN